MSELRKDYVLDRWVIISTGRKKRPRELARPADEHKPETDFFAPGNEHLTPAEIGRIEKNGKWQIRWFPNKFPAVTPEGNATPRTDNKYYTFADAYGYHEIIVESPNDRQLFELSVDNISEVLKVYSNRIDDLEKKQGVAYVNVFKNHGPLAGTSILHSHSQVITTSVLPTVITQKISACKKFVNCPYCDIIARESKSDRACFENDEVIAFAPYASRYNYECWIFPKKHITSFADIPFASFADILKKILTRIHSIPNISYNYAVHYSPVGENLHVHLEVYPDIAIWGGFERGSGMVINSVSPEDAAKFYRGEE